jgi:hypothetical protein
MQRRPPETLGPRPGAVSALTQQFERIDISRQQIFKGPDKNGEIEDHLLEDQFK